MITLKLSKKHSKDNEKLLAAGDIFHASKDEPYIENQEEWGSIAYGWHPRSNMSHSGCGVIAVWNAFVFLGKIPTEENRIQLFTKMMAFFEKYGTVLGGLAGTSLPGVYLYLKKNTKKSHICVCPGKFHMRSMGINYDAFVVMLLNDRKKLKKGMHYVCVTKDEMGFKVHNGYKKNRMGKWSESRAFPALDDAIMDIGKNIFIVAVIGIKKYDENS